MLQLLAARGSSVGILVTVLLVLSEQVLIQTVRPHESLADVLRDDEPHQDELSDQQAHYHKSEARLAVDVGLRGAESI